MNHQMQIVRTFQKEGGGRERKKKKEEEEEYVCILPFLIRVDTP